jgi:hypothetical protein
MISTNKIAICLLVLVLFMALCESKGGLDYLKEYSSDSRRQKEQKMALDVIKLLFNKYELLKLFACDSCENRGCLSADWCQLCDQCEALPQINYD